MQLKCECDSGSCAICRKRNYERRRRAGLKSDIDEDPLIPLRASFPSKPLIQALRAAQVKENVHRLNRYDTLRWDVIDRWCVKLGLHPFDLYPDWFEVDTL